MYDFIGDIHGYADKLEALLKKDGVFIEKWSLCSSRKKSVVCRRLY
jgi:hypothetical protein